VYASANPLSSDPNYSDLVGKIRELDVLALESTIDFSQEEYHNSLWIWDDCDSGFTVSLEDLDSRLTEEELLSVTDRVKATRCSRQNVRQPQSGAKVDPVLHDERSKVRGKPLHCRTQTVRRCFENKIVGEATGIVLFPASMKKNLLARFITEKLSFEKQDAEDILKKLEWFQYDFLYISHRTSRPFILTSDFLKVYDM
jgi:hypothetical protein